MESDPNPSPVLLTLLGQLRTEPSRTGSMVVTVYGDAIAPRGGEAPVTLLLRLFRLLRVGGGAVRTAVSRLSAEGWLAGRRDGRHGFYRLTDWGGEQFRVATVRIYGPLERSWPGFLQIVIPPAGSDRAALESAGYAVLAPGVLVGISALPPAEGLSLQASADPATLLELARRVWPLERVASAYTQFIVRFGPLAGPAAGFGPADAILARVLLVHEYRRVVLRDPHLPRSLLPQAWPGWAARRLCGDLYAHVLSASERWLDGAGTLPHADPALFERFSGGDKPPLATASLPTRSGSQRRPPPGAR